MNMEALPIILEENLDDDEDILLAFAAAGLFGTESAKRIDHRCFERFDLDSFSEAECKLYFRFEKEDIPRLYHALMLPEKIISKSGTVATGLEGLCLTLQRMAYPNRYVDHIRYFGRSKEESSMIFNKTINIIHQQHAHRL
jgi:hypothetical protein